MKTKRHFSFRVEPEVMEKVLYRSTNGHPEIVDFKTVLLRGQAPDKGLYMPDKIPVLCSDIIKSIPGMSYTGIAFTVISQFLEDEMPSSELKKIVDWAYNFDMPVERVYGRKYVLWLDEGPTLSFKDLAARMMSRLMQYYMKDEKKHLIILIATSGDTGSAVANAFHSLDNIDCVVLFPEKEVTELQRRQMTTLGGNVKAFAVDGKFDDCQAMVKQAFADSELEYLNLSSANSINFGRLLPQLVQYFYAYSISIDKPDEKPVISVPSGNFGHITAGFLAKHMGLPVHRFVVATNENDEFPRFLKTGFYKPIIPSRVCISNAMNVGHPSNLIRIIDLYGGNMDENGKMRRMPDLDSMRKDIFSVSISDHDTRRTIKEVYEKHKIILEPHGAVAWAGLSRYLEQIEDWEPCVSFETADPGKFPKEIIKALGFSPETPNTLRVLKDKEEEYIRIPKDYNGFKTLLKRGC